MKILTLCCLLLCSLLTATAARSQSDNVGMQSKPVWEAGLGAGYLNSVDYPGSNDPNIAQFALPFFIYRSEIFRVGDGGVGAVAVEEPRLKLDVSFGGALNAESEPGSVREGLPDLDLLFEFGPRLQVNLLQKQWNSESRSRLDWDSKVRAVIGTDFKSARARGFIFSTGLAYRQRAIAGDKVDLVVNADLTFADQRFNDYIYTVSPDFMTPQRASYEAKPGYVESRAFLGVAIRPVPSLRIFTGMAFFSYANSANESSPLFETDTSTQYAVGMVWAPFRSRNTIDVFSSE